MMIGLLVATVVGACFDLAGAPALLGGPLAAVAGLIAMPVAAYVLEQIKRGRWR